MNPITRVLVLCLLAVTSNAQEAHPVFEAADIHSSAPSTVLDHRGAFVHSGGYELMRYATMVDLIGAAYGVDPDKVVGGPPWLDTDRFDVVAKGPANGTAESFQLMLQALLADRFQLIVHTDTRPFPEYVLSAEKHPKFKESSSTADSVCHPGALSNASVSCRNTTMAQFVATLPRLAGDYFQGNPVLDRTRLKGSWDFTLQWTRRNSLPAPGAGGISIYDALRRQLGLKLDVQKVPMAVIAVDRVNQKPTPNLSGVSQSLPSIPTEFEVAVIKPSAPGSTQRNLRIEPGGRIDLRGFTLKALIKFAWNFQDNDAIDNDDMLVGAPKLLDAERFDIVAMAPIAGLPTDIDSLHRMLRALLIGRFKLATHNENRAVAVYALVPSKPKLKKADSSNRSGCRNAPVPPGASAIFSVSCHNTTMAQLAERLQPMGGIYIPHPVIDSTGLEGAWDFVLSWSPPHLIDGATSEATTDPNGGITLVEALEKQLGLKLKPQKHPMPVLVIDRAEPSPSGN